MIWRCDELAFDIKTRSTPELWKQREYYNEPVMVTNSRRCIVG